MTLRKTTAAIFAAVLLLCVSAVCLGTAEAADDESYVLTIPGDFSIDQSGWNAIGTIAVKSSGDNGFTAKGLIITVSSDNNFALKSGTSSIDYTFTTAAGGSETTEFTFASADINATNGVSQTVGVIVEDYDDKPFGTYEDTLTYTAEIDKTVVDLATLTADYEAQDGEVLTGKLGSAGYKITVAAGATIILKDVDITSISNDESHKYAGITPLGNATIILEGTNAVKGGYANYPGIFISPDYTLTIKGSGSLTASSNGWGAGIGGAYEIACGNIVIEGGNVTAQGGSAAAGIGGSRAVCGTITISGGNVTAQGGSGSAGIGSGNSGSCGDILISGGSVDATGGGRSAGIGSGFSNDASCGTITITAGVTRVTATAGGNVAGEGWTNPKNSIGVGDKASCGTVTIGGTVYWDGSSYKNGGDTYLTQDTLTYPQES